MASILENSRVTLGRKALFFDSETYAFLTHDHAVQVAPLLKAHNIAGKNILGDEHAVENKKLRLG
jgi:hypothetical protein